MLHKGMEIVYTKTALKDLRGITPTAAKVIRAKIAHYAAAPASLTNMVERMQGSDFYRLRVGDYRVIFSADGLVLTIIKVGHRREIYRH